LIFSRPGWPSAFSTHGFIIINPKARRSLPKEQRQTDEQAEAFAMQTKDKYKFSSDSADPYQTVRGYRARP
jgi:hypothetical protein